MVFQEVGWKWTQAFTLRNQHEEVNELFKHSPAMVRLMLLEAWQAGVERRAAARRAAMAGPEFLGRRVAVMHIRRCLSGRWASDRPDQAAVAL